MIAFRVAIILWIFYVGFSGYRQFGTGELRIRNFNSPPRIILRSERPAAYWTCVGFFYAVMLAIIALAAFAPT